MYAVSAAAEEIKTSRTALLELDGQPPAVMMVPMI